MALVVKITRKKKPDEVRTALQKLTKQNKKGKKKLSDFYGKMPTTYGDGLAYQKKMRNDW